MKAPRPVSSELPRTTIERLEDRIAPATLVNPTTVTYTDTDGDLVTVKITKGTFDLSQDFVFASVRLGQQLQTLKLNGKTEFGGATVSVTAAAAGGGNGSVDVGYVNATGIDLAGVTIDGDLGQIDAGDSIVRTPGLGFLKVGDLGTRGIFTQQAGGNLVSDIVGRLGSVRVKGALESASISVDGDRYGSIGSISIGENMVGGSFEDSGTIWATGNIGALRIGGGLFAGGAGGTSSGRIDSGGDIASVTIGGNMIGGPGNGSGVIQAQRNLGPVVIGGSLLGSTAWNRGS